MANSERCEDSESDAATVRTETEQRRLRLIEGEWASLRPEEDRASPSESDHGSGDQSVKTGHADAINRVSGQDQADLAPAAPDLTAEWGELSIDQAEFLGAEFRTDVGSAFFTVDDDNFRRASEEVPEYRGEYVLDVHGTPESVLMQDVDHNLYELNAEEFADVVRRTDWSGEPIRLFSCSTAQLDDGFAQQLSDELGTSVTGPTRKVASVVDETGAILEPVIADVEGVWDPELGDLVKRRIPGQWITCWPK